MKLLTPDPGLLIWTLLSFLIVFYFLAKMAWPAIIKGLKEREQNISDALTTAITVRAEMAALVSENEALMAQAREERSVMIREAREQTIKMIDEAVEELEERLCASANDLAKSVRECR